MVLTLVQIAAMTGLLLFGGVTTIAQNDYLMYSTTNFPGYQGQIVNFGYPWYGNFIMFAAMICIGLLWIYQYRRDGKKIAPIQKSVTMKLLTNPWIVLSASSIFDLAASGMMSTGLDWGVSASVYQILNGAIVLFTPILSFFFLKRKTSTQQIIGMFIVMIGLGTVALSSYFVSEFFVHDNTNTKQNSTLELIFGVILILSAQLVYAGQFVLEEFSMQKLDCYPAQVVCVEGIYGLAVTLFFTMPIFDMAGAEQDFDAFIFAGVEPKIIIPQSIFFIFVALYNAFGQTVTKLISANHRTIMEGLRGLVVWIFALIERLIFGSPWGETWNGWASWIQAGGFLINLIGGFVFYDIIPIPGLKKIETKELLDDNIREVDVNDL